MAEKIMVEFTEKEFNNILDYQKKIEADTIQDAILIAICVARLYEVKGGEICSMNMRAE